VHSSPLCTPCTQLKSHETKQNPQTFSDPTQKTVKQYSQLFCMFEFPVIWKHVSLSSAAVMPIAPLHWWIPGDTKNRKEQWVHYHDKVTKFALSLLLHQLSSRALQGIRQCPSTLVTITMPHTQTIHLILPATLDFVP